MAKTLKFADIERAEDCRARLKSLEWFMKIDQKEWGAMGIRSQGCSYNNQGDLNKYFKNTAAVMREAAKAEIARLRTELTEMGVAL